MNVRSAAAARSQHQNRATRSARHHREANEDDVYVWIIVYVCGFAAAASESLFMSAEEISPLSTVSECHYIKVYCYQTELS
jgi:hypothetical protein